MQVPLKKLDTYLKKETLAPVYLISGDEPLLVQEARDAICAAAKAAGIQQKVLLSIEPGFDWSTFDSHTQNYHLFSEQCLIDLRHPTGKWGTQGTDRLLRYVKQPNPEKTLIISLPKLSAADKKTRWYRAIDQQGVSVAVWPVPRHELPQWIRARAHQLGLTVDSASIQLLADCVQGNLLAAQQALIKLKALYRCSPCTMPQLDHGSRAETSSATQKAHAGSSTRQNNKHAATTPHQQTPITLSLMQQVITDSARFTIFDLTQYALQGNATQAARIIHSLQAEGVEPILVLWALSREVKILIPMKQQMNQGIAMAQVLAKQWSMRKPLLQNALKQLSLQTLTTLLQSAAMIDQMIKGIYPGKPWEALMQFSVALAGKPMLNERNHDVFE